MQSNWVVQCAHCHAILGDTINDPKAIFDENRKTISLSVAAAEFQNTQSELLKPLDCKRCHKKGIGVMHIGL